MSASMANHDNVTQVPSPETFSVDIERKAVGEAHLRNTTVHNFSWKGITVTVKDRDTKQPKAILDNIDGIVKAGTQEGYLRSRVSGPCADC
jgi:hypothetical protein